MTIVRVIAVAALAGAGALGGAALAPPVAAQPAAAIGQPLPDPQLRDGTVSLRVIAGDPQKPVSGVEATLVATPPDGTSPPLARRARTDADGRVSFADVSPDATVQLKVPSEAAERGEVESVRFPMPASGGVRVMLSTVPFAGNAAVPAGGAMGRPGAAGGPPATPRAMSGQARPDPDVPADTVTVRLSYDDFADPSPPRDHPVVIVGYRFDLVVGGKVVKSDAQARATIDGLDRRGATSYFAMTLLPRGDDHDRLISAPLVLGSGAGLRLVLSGARRDEATVADDLGALDPQPSAGVPAGEVHVTLAGLVEGGEPVELLDALTGQVVATTRAGPPGPDLDSLEATWDGADDAALASGALVLSVDANTARATGARVEVRPRPAVPPPVGAPPPPSWTAVTDGNGEARLTGLPTGVTLELALVVDGLEVPVRTLSLPAAGGRRELARVTWRPRGQGAARFTGVAGGPERAYVVRSHLRGQPCLSPPFQLTARRGAAATVLVFPRVLFSFSLRASVHDVYLGARGTFTVRNNSLAPYLPGTIGKPEELVVSLPRGFVGATVDDRFSEAVGVDPTRGFVVRDPVPPGGFAFVGHFSLKTDGGAVRWDMDLPYGTLESGMELRRTPAMELELPPRVPAREAVDERGTWYVLSPISIQPKQRLVFTVTGLPQRPTWVRWSKPAVGALVVLLLLGAAVLALYRPRQTAAAAAASSRYDQLVDEVAALTGSADPDDVARRERLMGELEALVRARDGGAEAR